MTGILVDSDVLIQVARRRDPPTLARWEELAGGGPPIYCSPVSVAEIWRGLRPGEEPILAGIFGAMLCLPIDEATGRCAGDFMRRFAKSHGLEIADALIAATVSLHELALWTRNRKHYPMPGIAFWG